MSSRTVLPAVSPTVVIRPLTSADLPLLRRGFGSLSAQTRQLRFGLPLSDVDHALEWVGQLRTGRHFALGACARAHGVPIGVARYALGDAAAEVAVTIADDWQGRGVGTRLLQALVSHARDRQVPALTAWISAQNRRAIRLTLRAGAHRIPGRYDDLLQYRIPLTGAEPPRR